MDLDRNLNDWKINGINSRVSWTFFQNYMRTFYRPWRFLKDKFHVLMIGEVTLNEVLLNHRDSHRALVGQADWRMFLTNWKLCLFSEIILPATSNSFFFSAWVSTVGSRDPSLMGFETNTVSDMVRVTKQEKLTLGKGTDLTKTRQGIHQRQYKRQKGKKENKEQGRRWTGDRAYTEQDSKRYKW